MQEPCPDCGGPIAAIVYDGPGDVALAVRECLDAACGWIGDEPEEES